MLCSDGDEEFIPYEEYDSFSKEDAERSLERFFDGFWGDRSFEISHSETVESGIRLSGVYRYSYGAWRSSELFKITAIVVPFDEGYGLFELRLAEGFD